MFNVCLKLSAAFLLVVFIQACATDNVYEERVIERDGFYTVCGQGGGLRSCVQDERDFDEDNETLEREAEILREDDADHLEQDAEAMHQHQL